MRSGRLLLVLLAVLPFTACSGADAQRAQSLLDRASLAEAKARSLSFSGTLRIQSDGEELGVRMSGGVYLRGPRAGDMLVDTELIGTPTALAGAPFHRVRLGIADQRVWSEVDGRRNETLDLRSLRLRPSGGSADTPFAAFDPTRYVTDVSVDGGQVVNGRPMTKIVGTLDTAAMVRELARMGAAWTRSAPFPLADVARSVSDTRVVLFVDDTTHLLMAALADVELAEDGHTVKLHLDYALTGVNKPLKLPSA